MDGTGIHHVTSNKLVTERQIPQVPLLYVNIFFFLVLFLKVDLNVEL